MVSIYYASRLLRSKIYYHHRNNNKLNRERSCWSSNDANFPHNQKRGLGIDKVYESLWVLSAWHAIRIWIQNEWRAIGTPVQGQINARARPKPAGMITRSVGADLTAMRHVEWGIAEGAERSSAEDDIMNHMPRCCQPATNRILPLSSSILPSKGSIQDSSIVQVSPQISSVLNQ